MNSKSSGGMRRAQRGRVDDDTLLHWLDRRGVSYETLDVIEDPQAMREMEKLSGQDLAPVIDVDGKILADFGPDELEEWWKEQGFTS